MRRMGIVDMWRVGADRAVTPRSRAFGNARASLEQRLTSVLTAESLFRLVLAFVLATALWLYVTSRNAPEASFAYPQPITVSARNIGQNLTVRGLIPDVHINVRPEDIGAPVSSFVATIDLTGHGAGFYGHVPIQLQKASGIPIISYSPHYVGVALEPITDKTVPVRIQILSFPPNGFVVRPGTLTASPSTVRVAGAQSYVKLVASAVVSVSLNQARSGVNVTYSPVLENGQGRPLPNRVTVSPQRIRIHAVIEQLSSFKTVPILASLEGGPAPGFGVTSIRIDPPDTSVFGSRHALGSLQFLRTARVRVSGLKGGHKTFLVGVSAPRGVKVTSRMVHLTLTIGPIMGAAATRVVVTPTGVPAGEVASIKPSTTLVTFTGPGPLLGKDAGAIHAVIDLTGLGVGTFVRTPSIHHPRHIHVKLVQPDFVTISIRRG